MLLGAASCSQEEVQAPVKGDGNVNLTISLPGVLGTRAFADGLTAENLEMAVYDAETGNLVQTPAPVSFGSSLSTNVSLSLANGRAYKIAFFAHKQGSAYTFSAADKNITVDYDAMAADYNTDSYDCFYKLYETEVITGPVSHAITLTRPVAQVNWGTSDLDNSTVEAIYGEGCANLISKVSAKAYTEFSLLDSDVVAESETDVDLALLARPAATEAFPVEPLNYEYLSMQYLFVPAAGTVSDLKLEITNVAGGEAQHTVNVTNAPLQANYRTNIFGALFTSPLDLTITKDENFGGNNNIPQVITADMLTEGGNIVIQQEIEEIEIPASMEAPLTITLNAPVEKVTLPASNDQAVSIVIGKDVAYPEFAFTAKSELKDLTIKGDPTSTESFRGFVFYQPAVGMPATHTDIPKSLENLVLDGLRFENGGFVSQWVVSTKNIVIRNCVFNNCVGTAVGVQHHPGGAVTANGMTVENCTITMAEDAVANQNSLYLLDITGDIIVKNNNIKGSKYHGVFISLASKAGVPEAKASNIEISGNTIAAKKDGIKIQDETEAIINVSNNTIAVTENGIRIKDAIAGLNCTITGNTIDMANAIEWNGNDQEPSGILLFNATENATPSLLNVTGNTFVNSNGHNISQKNINATADSTIQE